MNGLSPTSSAAGCCEQLVTLGRPRLMGPKSFHCPHGLAASRVSASTPWEESGCLPTKLTEFRNPISPASRPSSSPPATTALQWPCRVQQRPIPILCLFKRSKSDFAVSFRAIHTHPWPGLLTPTQLLPLCCAIRPINRKFLGGKLDCCSIKETNRPSISMHGCGLANCL